MNIQANDFHTNLATLFSPTWSIQDSTKLKTYMECPRKYFYNYILGWSKEGSNIHFVFGSAIHLALEYLLQTRETEGELSLKEHLPRATELFLKEYRKDIPPDGDDSYHPKSPAGAIALMRDYINKYKNTDTFKLLYTEIAGNVPLDEDDVIHFKMDAIIEIESGENAGLWALEHKTTTRLTQAWQMGWQTDIQPGTYIHALNCCFDDKNVQGCMINGLIVHKKEETNEFVRIPVKKDYERLRQWLWHRRYTMARLQQDFDALSETKPTDDLMTAFPMNETACTKYGLCPYHAICTSPTFTNPLTQINRPPPLGFNVKHWDPREKEETAKAIIKDGKIEEKRDV